MDILVTGGSGFIGKNVQAHLSDKYNIINISTSMKSNYIKISENFSDINEKLQDKEFECILHLASVIPKNFVDTNFDNVFLPNAIVMDNIYKLASEKRVNKFIYMSSFGSMEDYENYKIKDYYTLSKIHGEHVCSMMENQGIQTASLRIPSPYGPHLKTKNVINIFLERALKDLDLKVYGSGMRQQNFIFIEDVVNAIDLFISTKNKIDGVYNVVSENNTSMLELAKIVKEKCNSKSKIILGDTHDIQEDYIPKYDYTRANKSVEYKPQYTINSGLDKYIEWYVNNI